MIRRVSNVIALVSLLLCLAVAAFWVRSVWCKSDLLRFTSPRFGWRVCSERGTISIARDKYVPRKVDISIWSCSDPYPTHWRPFDYLRIRWDFFPDGWTEEITVADWLLMLIFAVLPIKSFVNRLCTSKTVGLCAKCNYDLRGTAEGRPCPECGAQVNRWDVMNRSSSKGLRDSATPAASRNHSPAVI